MKLWNIYRNRFLARYYYNLGINVIPNIQILEPNLWDEVVDGLPQNSVLSVNCSNLKRRPIAKQLLISQIEYIINRLNPLCILCYGDESLPLNFRCKSIVFSNNNINRIRLCTKEQNYLATTMI